MKDIFYKLYSQIYFLKLKIQNDFSEDEKKIYTTVFKGCCCIIIFSFLVCLFSNNAFFAGYTIDTSGAEDKFKDFFNETYGIIIGSATFIAVVLVAINIVTIMSSKNQRKIEQAVTWIKAIVIAWFCLCLISFVIGLIKTEYMIPAINGSDAPLFTY